MNHTEEKELQHQKLTEEYHTLKQEYKNILNFIKKQDKSLLILEDNCKFIGENIYYTKFNISKDDSCYGHESCKQFYLEMLSTCLTDLEKSTQNTSYFDQDFVKILQKSIQVNLSMYLTSEKEQFIITKKNLFILILSMAFDYSSNIKNYFENYRSIYLFI